MNHIYKVIWSKITQSLVVVSELATNQGKAHSSTSRNTVTQSSFSKSGFKLSAVSALLMAAMPTANAAVVIAGNSGNYWNVASASGASVPYNYGTPNNTNYPGQSNSNIYSGNLRAAQSISIGANTNATSGSIAFGDYSSATGGLSLALGPYSRTTQAGAIALGTSALASGFDSFAAMRQAAATADFAMAMGTAANANGNSSIAMGSSALALGMQSIAIGSATMNKSSGSGGEDSYTTTHNNVTNTKAQGDRTIALGVNTSTTSNDSIAIGTNTKTNSGTGAIAIGWCSSTSYQDSVAMGSNATANGAYSVALGFNATSTNSSSISIGWNSAATNTQGGHSQGSVAIGPSTVAKGNQSVALGAVAQAAEQATAIGNDARASGFGSIVIGGDDTGYSSNKSSDPYTYASTGNVIGYLPYDSANSTYSNYRTSVSSGVGAVTVGVHGQALSQGSTAIGVYATAGDNGEYIVDNTTTTNAIEATAIGAMARAKSKRSTAIGYSADALNEEATAIGSNATANSTDSMALGSNSTANGSNSLAAGYNATTNGLNALAIGSSAQALAENAISIGTGNIVTGKNSGAIGDPTTITGSGTYSIGNNNGVIAADDSGVFGNNNDLTGAASGSRIIGNDSSVSASDGFVMGNRAQVKGEGGVAVGNNAIAEESYDMAIGYSAKATGTGGSALAVGTNANASGTNAVGIGNGASATNTSAIALGGAASGYSSTALGYVTKAEGTSSTAVGYSANAKGAYSTAVGSTANASGTNSISIGGSSSVSSSSGVAIGTKANTTGTEAIALGANADSTVDGGVALGANSQSVRGIGAAPYIPDTASTAQSDAINATKATTGAVSVGSDTVKRQIINVAAGSEDSDAVNVAQLKAAVSSTSWNLQNNGVQKDEIKSGDTVNFVNGTGTVAQVTGNSTNSTVKYSVDMTGLNVASDGTVSAVKNGDKFATAEQVAKAINDSEKTTTVNSTNGTISATATTSGTVTNYDLDLSQAAKDSLAKADSALQSWTAQVNGADAKVVNQTNNTVNFVNGTNTVVSADANGNISVSTAENVTFNTVNASTFNAGDVTINNNGINAGSHTITNVANGTKDSDAVNLSQLNATNANVANNTQNITNNANNISNNTKAIANNTQNITTNANNIAANTAAIKQGFNIGADNGNDDNVQLGETVNYNGDSNIITTVSDNAIAFALNSSIAVDNVTVNDTFKAGDVTINKAGIDAGNHAITNVTAGTNATDAVNVAQLNASQSSVKAGDNVNVTSSKDANGTVYTVNANTSTVSNGSDKVTVTKTAAGNHTSNYAVDLSDAAKSSLTKADSALQSWTAQVNGSTAKVVNQTNNTVNFVNGTNTVVSADASGNISVSTAENVTFNTVNASTFNAGDVSISNNGINAGNHTITNVANGTKDSDAVNLSQLNATNANVANNAQNITNNANNISNNTKAIANNTQNITTNANNIAANTAAIKQGFNIGADNGNDDNVQLGETVNYNGDSNIITTVSNNAIAFALNPSLNLTDAGSVTMGDVVVNNGGITIANGTTNNQAVSLTKDGLNNGGNKITNVANGTQDSDAVSLAQLNASQSSVKAGDNVNVTSAKDANGTVYTVNANTSTVSNGSDKVTVTKTDAGNHTSNYAVDLSQSAKDSLTKADSALQSWTAQVNGADAKVVNQTNNTVNFVNGTNTVVSADASGNISVSTADNVTFNTVNASTFNAGDVTINNNGINAGNHTITNVANGTKDSDAVNFSQLNATNTNVANNAQNITNNTNNITNNTNAIANNTQNITNNTNAINKGINFGNGTKANNFALGSTINVTSDSNLVVSTVTDGVKLTLADSIAVGNVTVNDTFKAGNVTINNSGIDAGNHAITNVTAGTNATDAVNLGQLNASKSQVKSGDNTEVTSTSDANGTVYTVNANTSTVSNGSDKVTVTKTNAGNHTSNYAVDLSDAAKSSLTKADSALQSWTAQVNGAEAKVVNQTSNTVNFVNGTNTVVSADASGNISVSTAESVTFNTVNASTFNAGDVSISNNGINAGNHTITNVANGTKDSDAVNFSQLNATNTNVANNAQNITNNANNISNNTKAIANNTQNITTNANNIAANTAAIKQGFNIGADKGNDDNVQLGETVNYNGDSNIITTVSDNAIAFALNSSIAVDNVTVNDTFKAGDVTINSAGIDAGNHAITNVTAGTNATDAVNLGQLEKYIGDNSYNWNLSDGINNSAVADNSTVAIKGSANADSAKTAGIVTALDGTNVSVDLSEQTKSDIQQGVDANTTVNNKGITFAADSGAATERKLGESLAVNGDGDLINTTASAGKIEVAATDKLKNAVTNATSALQSVVTQIDGKDVKTLNKADNKANFVSGDNISLTNDGQGGIKIATKENVTFNTVNASTFNAGDVSISSNGINAGGKVVTNVANGTKDSDAVNLSQLNATNTNVANNAQNITNNTNAIANNTQNITNNTNAINKGINFGNGTSANKFALGSTINVKPSDSNLVVKTVADGVELALADSIAVSNVTVNDTFKAGDVTINNSGIDAGNHAITNVTAGTNATDAVNLGQLEKYIGDNSYNWNLSDGTTSNAVADNSTVSVKGSANADSAKTAGIVTALDGTNVSVDLSQKTKDDIQQGVDANTTVNSKGITFAADGGTATERKLGETLTVNGDGDLINTTASAGKIAVSATDKLKDAVTNATSALQSVVTQIDGKDVKTLNKADNKANFVSGDNISLTNDGQGGIKIATKDNVTFTTVNATTFNAGDVSISSNGINAGGKTVTNVANGTKDSDAVNLSQLNATNTNVANNAQNITNNTNAIANNTQNITNNTNAINKGINFGNVTTATKFNLGDTINVTSDSNLVVSTVTDGVKLTLADSIAVGNVTVNNTFKAGDVTINKAGIDAGNHAITNVTAGTNATDAVNVAQLNASQSSVKAGDNVNVTSAKDANGMVYTVNANTSTVSNGSDKVTVTKTAAGNHTSNYAVDLSDAAKSSLTKADSALQSLTTSADGNQAQTLNQENSNANFISGNNIQLTPSANGITVATKADVTFTNVTATNVNGNTVTIGSGANTTTLTSTAEGLDVGGDKLTNISAGTNATDAVNLGQLEKYIGDNSYNWNLSDGTNSNAVADNSTVAIKGSANADSAKTAGIVTALDGTNVSVDLSEQTKSDIQQGVNANTTVSKGFNIGADKGADDNVQLGETVNYNGDSNIITTVSNNAIAFALNSSIAVDNVTVNDTFKAGDVTINNNGIDAGNHAITNVTAGTNATDAVNVAQLNASQSSVKAGDNVNVTSAKDANGTVYTVNANTSTVSNGSDKVTVTKTDAGNHTSNYAVDLSQSAKDSLTKADSALQSWTAQVNGADAKVVNQTNNTVNFVNGTNTVVSADASGNISVSTAENVTFNTVNASTFNAGGVSISSNGINAGGKVVTNVANGTQDSDAVNLSQLNATNTNVANNAQNITNNANNITNNTNAIANNTQNITNNTNTINKGINFGNGTKANNFALGSTINVTSDSNLVVSTVTDGVKLTLADSITVGNVMVNDTFKAGDVTINSAGIDAGNHAITNVTAGTNATDAVNVAQLEANTTRYYSVNSTATGNRKNDGATGANAMAAGANATASGDNATAIGQGTKANSAAAIAIGNNANATSSSNDSVIAIGNNAQSTGSYSIAVGTNSVASNTWSMAMGISAKATGDYATGLGSNAQATAQWTTALGAGANATESAATAVGSNATAGADGATVIGYNSSVTGANTTALGNNINVSTEGSVVLGNNSAAATATTETAATVNNLTYSGFAGAGNVAAGDYVSVGSAGQERQIKYVAPGNISATSTDAINGSQLYATNQVLGNVANSVVNNFGGNAAVDSNGNITFTNIGDTGQNTIHDAIKSVSDVANTGWNVQTNGDTATKVAPGDTVQFKDGKNIKITRTEKDITVATADDVSFNSISAGPVTINSNGIDAGNKTITNVAAGINGTDAVNLDQLNQTISANAYNWNISDGTNKADVPDNGTVSVKGSANADSAKTAGIVTALDGTNVSVDLSEQTKSDIQQGVNANTTVSKGFNIGADKGSDDNVQLGETVNYNGDSNIITTVSDNAIAFALNSSLNLTDAGSVTMGDVVVNNGGITIANGTTNNQTVSLTKDGLNNGGNKITNVANGTQDSDAVNLAQLNASQSSVKAGDNVNVTSAKDANGTVYTVNANTSTVSNGSDKVTVTKTDAGNHTSNYAVDLSQSAKDSLTKADSALQSWTAQVNGSTAKVVNQTNNTVNFVNGTNTVVSADASGNISVSTAENVTFNTVNASTFNAGDVTINNSGINAGNHTITNVANGTKDSDAVNFSQLNATNTNVANNAQNITNNANNISNNTKAIANNTQNITTNANNIAANTAAIKQGFNIGADNGNDDNVQLGETVNYNGDSNIITTVSDNAIAFALNSSIAVDNVTVNDTFKAGDVTINKAGIDAGNHAITNVTAGTNATDAVNVAQLNASQSSVKAGDNVNVTSAKDANGTVYTVNANTSTVSNGSDKVTVTKTDAGNHTSNYAVDLSDAAKSSLTKADSALQSLTTSADGNQAQTLNQENSNANFISGNNIQLTPSANGITVATKADVTFTNVTATNVNGNTVTIGSGANTTTLTSTAEGLDVGGDKLTNISAGTNATDAVNLGQLEKYIGDNSYNWNLSDGTNNSAVADNSTVAIKGSANADSAKTAGIVTALDGTNVSVDLSEQTKSDIQQGVNANTTVSKGFNIGADKGNDDNVQLGETVKYKGDSNIITTVSNNTIAFALNPSLNLTGAGSVTIGDVVVNNGGITIANANGTTTTKTVSLTKDGLNNGGNKITNVADAEALTDAVNLGQLQAAINVTTANAGWNLTVNGTDSSKVKPKDTVDLANKDGNINITKSGNNVAFDLSDKLNIGSGANTVVIDGTTGKVSAGNVSIGKDGISAGGQTITNVAPGVNGTDAVNVDQLRNFTSSVVDKPLTFAGDTGTPSERKMGSTVTVKGGVSDTTKLTDNNIGVVSDGQGSLNVKLAKDLTGLNSVTISNGSASTKLTTVTKKNVEGKEASALDVGGNQITNVAPGEVSKDSTDAVNGSQLHATNQQVIRNANAINQVAGQVHSVDRKLRAGVAGALASGGLYHATMPGKSMVAAGAGTYRGESAIAVGYSRLSDNGKLGVKFSVNSNTRGDTGAAASVGYQW